MTAGSGRDHDITHALAMLHHDARVAAFKNATMVSATWEPSSYSGLAYNVGLPYAVNTDITAYFPRKVTAKQQAVVG